MVQIFKPGETCEQQWSPLAGGIGPKWKKWNQTGITNCIDLNPVLEFWQCF